MIDNTLLPANTGKNSGYLAQVWSSLRSLECCTICYTWGRQPCNGLQTQIAIT